MTVRTNPFAAAALALPFGVAASAAHAADLLETAKGMNELSTFSEAVAAAGLDQQLKGEGPFTVFAPTNEAFERLPMLDDLLQQEHQAELSKLLSHHVVDGKAVTAEEVAGRAMSVDTAAGGQVTVDGTDEVILVMLAAPAAHGASGAKVGGAQSTEVSERGDMPMSEHQQEVLASDVGEEARQTAPAGGMPATEHQKEVLRHDQGATAGSAPGAQSPEHATAVEPGKVEPGTKEGAQSTEVSDQGDMPMSEHQQEVLASDVGEEARQTAPAGGMPATEHQKEVLRQDEGAMAGGEAGAQSPQHATVVAPGVEADNGVIYVIDVVLVPQDTRQMLERLKGGA